MSRLELMLRDAGAALEWPATPAIASAVEQRIDTAPAPRRPHRIHLRRPLAIALAALLVATATAAAIPGVREPVLEWLGLRSVRIERVPRLPGQPAPARPLASGQRVASIAAARARLGFDPVVATGLGEPLVYLDRFAPGGQLGLVYGRRFVVTEVLGTLRREFFRKFVTPGTRVEAVRVAGERGLWLDGDVHELVYVDRDGGIRSATARLAGNVLLWRRGDLLLRLEGARTKAQALRIAAGVRAAP